MAEKERGAASSSQPLEPYRSMMPGMKEENAPGESRVEGERVVEEEEEEEEKPALPTPRKRLMNFKIPLVKGSQRRDQQQSVVATRRLFGEEQGMCRGGGTIGGVFGYRIVGVVLHQGSLIFSQPLYHLLTP
jgi:hypothetical protein